MVRPAWRAELGERGATVGSASAASGLDARPRSYDHVQSNGYAAGWMAYRFWYANTAATDDDSCNSPNLMHRVGRPQGSTTNTAWYYNGVMLSTFGASCSAAPQMYCRKR